MDADERHRIVSEAAWRVLLRGGPVELSVRNVAAEANLPPSSLRYTFPTQASVRDAAVGLLLQRLARRVERAMNAERGRDSARAILLELLPLDEERRAEMEVTVSFLTLAMTDPALREAYERTHAAVRGVCETALSHLGAGADRVDLTHAVIDGLAFHLLGRETGGESSIAIATLDMHLDLIGPREDVS